MFKSAFRRGYVSSQEDTTNMYYICNQMSHWKKQPTARRKNSRSSKQSFQDKTFLGCFLIIPRQALERNEHTFNQNMQPKPFKQQKPLRISINSLKFTSCFSPATPLLFITKQPNTARSSQSFSPQQQNVFQPHGR